MPWYVVYTKPRNEKRVADKLKDKGIETYCPLQEEVHQWSDRKKKVKVPVFRSYIFVHLGDYKKESVPILETAGVVKFLWWLGKPGIVRDDEINNIRHFLEEYDHVEVVQQYAKGEKVAITHGPLREQQGIIIDLDKRKAKLYINSLGISLKAYVPLKILQKLRNEE
jgi:transcription antitermination factor NusG